METLCRIAQSLGRVPEGLHDNVPQPAIFEGVHMR